MEQFLIRMPKKLKDFMKALAKSKGISLNAQFLQNEWAAYEGFKAADKEESK